MFKNYSYTLNKFMDNPQINPDRDDLAAPKVDAIKSFSPVKPLNNTLR